MKITRRQLRHIIKEELRILKEDVANLPQKWVEYQEWLARLNAMPEVKDNLDDDQVIEVVNDVTLELEDPSDAKAKAKALARADALEQKYKSRNPAVNSAIDLLRAYGEG